MNTRIKELRKSLKLTQEQFGKIVGVKGNTIGNYELSLRNPSNQIIISICREFGVNEDWLRTGEGEMFESMSEYEKLDLYIGRIFNEKDNFKKDLIKALCRLSEEQWDILKEIVAEIK